MKSNIQTYLNFRSDISYKIAPFIDVDMAIFSSLAYVNFNILKTHLPITLKNALKLIKQDLNYNYKRLLRIEDYTNLELLANTIRYQDIQIVQLSDIKDKETTTQFAATTLLLPDNTLVVCYRGTDDSIIGWHEDFNMYLNEPIGARNKAVKYLNEAANLKCSFTWNLFHKKLPIIIIGHSNGGNLALAASLYANNLHDRIKKVYNFDGPGLPIEDYGRPEYLEIIKKTITYTPSYSFFGRLFFHSEKIKVIDSCNQGLDQHNINSWLVDANGFIETTLDDQATAFFNRSDEFVAKLGTIHTKEFIDAFFNLKEINIKYKIDIIKFLQLMNIETKHAKNLINEY